MYLLSASPYQSIALKTVNIPGAIIPSIEVFSVTPNLLIFIE